MPADAETLKASHRANGALRLIAIGVVLLFLYWAANVTIAVLLAVLLAFCLDPVVAGLERMHIPRAFGALLVLLAASAVLVAIGYVAAGAVASFVNSWPQYSVVLRRDAATLDSKLSSLDRQISAIEPPTQRGKTTTAAPEPQPLPSARDVLLQGIGSIYAGLFIWTFLPFLVFFMLATKARVWRATIELFPDSQRGEVKAALHELSVVLRSFIAGNALVAAILIAACWAFFSAIHLDYALLAAVVSGILNLVPYLGAILSWVPPFLLGLTRWNTIGPYLGVAGVLSGLHLLAINVLMPAILGRRVHLNALAVTIALLFWGWFWGGFGLLLAIPITATIKVICDHVPGWQPVGRWLGAGV